MFTRFTSFRFQRMPTRHPWFRSGALVAVAVGFLSLAWTGVDAGPFQKKSNSRGGSSALKRIFQPRPAPPSKPVRSTPSRKVAPTTTRKSSSSPSREIVVSTGLSQIERKDPRQPRIFILGDSQGFTDFGPTLQRLLVEEGYEVLYHAVKNGTPYYWSGLWKSPVLTKSFPPAASPEQISSPTTVSMRPHTIEEYANAFVPDVFAIQAGTNFEVDLARDNPVQISKLIQGCLEKAEAVGAKVLWIGPPDTRDDVRSPEFQKLAIETLEGALAPWSELQSRSCFFDSRPVSPMSNRTRGDGEHPENELAREWARASAQWIDESVEYFFAEKMLTCQGGERGGAGLPDMTRRVVETLPRRTVRMKLRLSEKSTPEGIQTLPYTDAFSVFRYELLNPDEIYGIENRLTTDPANSNRYWVYVLHWTVHNSGTGPKSTKVAKREIDTRTTMELAAMEDHPLGAALGTMPQFNQFDDFLAPIFVSKDIMLERVTEAGKEIVSSPENLQPER